MEAFAYEEFVDRFSNELQIGTVYFFKNVWFELAELPLPTALAIPSNFIIILRGRTEIHLPRAHTVVPRLPSQFMDFRTVYGLQNRMLAGTLYFFTNFLPIFTVIFVTWLCDYICRCNWTGGVCQQIHVHTILLSQDFVPRHRNYEH